MSQEVPMFEEKKEILDAQPHEVALRQTPFFIPSSH
jgi:hypothetical protein